MYRSKDTTGLVVCAKCGTRMTQAESGFTPDGQLVCRRCNALVEAHAQIERGREAERAQANQWGSAGLVGAAIAAVAKEGADARAKDEHAQIEQMAQHRAGPDAVRCTKCGAFIDRRTPNGMCASCKASAAGPNELEVYLAKRKRVRKLLLIGLAVSLVVLPLAASLLEGAGVLPHDTLTGVIVLEFLLGAGLVRAFFIRVSDSI